MRKLTVNGLLVLLLAIAGVGLSSSASAVNPPSRIKNAVKPPAAPKAPAFRRTPAPSNGSASWKTPAQAKRPALGPAVSGPPAAANSARGPGGSLAGKQTALGKDSVNPANSATNKTANPPHMGRGAPLGKGSAAAANATLPKSAAPRPPPPRTIAQDFAARQLEHRQAIAATRSRLPVRPLPGERGFTGVPPAGESRFVANEMVFQLGPNVSREAAESAVRRLGFTTVDSQTSSLTGGTVLHLRAGDGRGVADAVRALEAENIGIAQPNYVFRLQQDANLAARTTAGDPGQYVVNKLHLGDIHRLATGSNVLVAVIDSAIDLRHPELAGAVVEEFDAVGRKDQPHLHGTGMAGAIAARRRLIGVAPAARILAVHAFSPEASETAQATTRHIIAGLEWAIARGARVINMSFAGPYDPMLALAMKKAREKGVVLVAAAGNLGPNSPPLYPAADPNVIAVTATDEYDHIFVQANQGPHIAVAAPGVNVLEPAPNAGYQVTTGTSVAAAHVSGVAALMLEHDPSLDPAAVHEILTISAWKLGSQGHDDRYGWGLVDPGRALQYVDAKMAADRRNGPANKPGAMSSR